MKKIRFSKDRGYANHGWLESFHTFSFADYRDPDQMGFGVLRVINQDIVEAGKGFGTHPHGNMEIISYVIRGQLEHKDSLGNGRTILPGEFQLISAGSGVTHSEFNPSLTQAVEFLQIWVLPEKKNLTPSYAELATYNSEGLTLVASPDYGQGPLKINQDLLLFKGSYKSGESQVYPIKSERKLWIQMIKGELLVDQERLLSGDGLAVTDEVQVALLSKLESSFLLFDMI